MGRYWEGEGEGERERKECIDTLLCCLLLIFACSECHSDGTHTCFFDFTVDANGQLSAEQLETLKNNLLKVFKLQHNQQPVNVQQIYEMDPEFEGKQDCMTFMHAHLYY